MKPITIGLIVLNLLSFVIMLAIGGWHTDVDLITHGALAPEYVREGEWWRIFTGAFMHAGYVHLIVNMIALFQLGEVLESMLGPIGMLKIYFGAMLGSGLVVTIVGGAEPTVGASGAIYGLFGALLAMGMRLGSPGRALVWSLFPVLIINLILTFVVPNISIAGHIGGLLSGFGLAWWLRLERYLPRRDTSAGTPEQPEATG